VTTQTSTWHGEPSYPPSNAQRAVPGTLIGSRYQLRTAIGHGGMGTVWQAVDTLLRRDVAVKEVVLPAGMAPVERDALYERTMREARAAAALSHPSIVQVYDVVTEAGRPWIVMELLYARSLADHIISDGPLAGRAVAKVGIALLGALEVAHSAGILHRDVKPANVLICTDGRCVLTDFGVARIPTESNLTSPGMVLGSPHFISPERAVGGEFGPPSDLFSLGVSLYTAVEGRPPFDKGDPFETMRAVVEEPPARAIRAGALIPVLNGLLDKDPERRFDVPTARGALRELLAGPLANPSSTHVTDPYAVLPPAPPAAEPPVVSSPGKAVGGRALLATGEMPEHHVSGPLLDPGSRHARQGGPAPGHPGLMAELGTVARRGGQAAGSTLRRLRRRRRLMIAGLATVAVGLVAALALVLFHSGSSKHPTGTQSPSAAPSETPPFPVQVYEDRRGMTLNLPADWKKSASSTYVDFTAPQDSGERLRVNVEPAGGTAQQFLTAAERNLKNPSRCTAPYHRVALTDATLAGQPAAELEYTCGSGDTARHGIWIATVIDKKAYEFYLSTEESTFAATRQVFDEAVRSYRLNLPK
jgi:eukaryotic-like serine/threonine-protein kinase